MHQLPDALAPMATYRQFIIYILIPSKRKPGKMDKLPCDFRTGTVAAKAEESGGLGGAHNPAIWTDFATAAGAAAQFNLAGGAPYGVGFVFTDNDPFWFLDIDSCYDPVAQQWAPVAQQLCQAFAGAAIEVSTSGRGLHIFGTGHVPQHRSTTAFSKQFGMEFYHRARFVALTGTNAAGSALADFSHLLPSLVTQFFPPDEQSSLQGDDRFALRDSPVPEWNGPTDDDKLIERAMRSVSSKAAFGQGATFADLWTRNVEVLSRVYPEDPGGNAPYNESSADAALAQLLCFWTGNHGERIVAIMQRSGLVREKWEREDYLPRTVAGCAARQTQFLTDLEPEPLAWQTDAVHAPASGAPERPRPTTVTGATFLSIDQQMDMFTGCVYVSELHRVLVPGGGLLKEGPFRVQFGGYTMPMDYANERASRDAWEVFTQSQAFRAPRADGTTFRPDRAPAEIIRDAGRTRANTWWPVDVPRKMPERPEDLQPFYTHLAKLLPLERDRMILLCYMAACVQHKGVKFQWAPLLQGVEGNGKTLLSRCVAEAVGRRYVHWPKASKLAKEFNAWMVGKVFYAVEDIYVSDGRRDVIEELKPMITGGDGLEIEGKGVDQISAEICGNFMFNSNHKDAILKTRKDRRFAVFYCAQQQAHDLFRDGMSGRYMSDIYNWLRADGYALVSELLHTFPIPDEYNPATLCQRAPDTSSTEAAIAASRGGVEQEVLFAIEQAVPGFIGGWVSSIALDNLLEKLNMARRIPRGKRHDLLDSLGFAPHPGLRDGLAPHVVSFPDGGRPRLYVRPLAPEAQLQGEAAIVAAYVSAQQVKMFSN